jgi:hypothetical protein
MALNTGSFHAWKLVKEAAHKWAPLKKQQQELEEATKNRRLALNQLKEIKEEQSFDTWLSHVKETKNDFDPIFTERGRDQRIRVHGFTQRGRAIETPRGHEVRPRIVHSSLLFSPPSLLLSHFCLCLFILLTIAVLCWTRLQHFFLAADTMLALSMRQESCTHGAQIAMDN